LQGGRRWPTVANNPLKQIVYFSFSGETIRNNV
jgi:hypothetical protein